MSQDLTNSTNTLPNIVVEEKDLAAVKEIRKSIDINNTMTIVTMDENITKELSDFNNKILSTVKNSSIPEMSELIAVVRNGVVSLDPSSIVQAPGFLDKIFGRAKNGLERYKEKSKTIAEKFSDVTTHIQDNINQAKDDYKSIEELFNVNKELFHRYELMLKAVMEEKEYQEKNVLPTYEEKAKSGDASDLSDLKEYQSALRELDKKIFLLASRRLSTIHSTQQIRNMRDNIIGTIINSTELLVSGIEEWKRDVAQGIIAHRTDAQANDIKNINALRNDIKRKSADLLYKTSVEVTNLSENGGIEVDTLRYVNQKLIQTVTDTNKIIEESDKKRKAALIEFDKLEKELFKTLEVKKIA